MTVRWKMFAALVAMVLAMSSCKDDTDALLEIDQVAQEQNETHTHALTSRTCALDHKMESLMQDADYRATHEAKFTKINKALEKINARASCSTPTLVPMAIHFQGVTNPDEACLIALAQSQVDILNKDFTGTNSDITNWTNQASSFFPGVSNGEACVQFCLADQNHPNGYGVANGSPAVTINKTTGDTDAAWSGYINIFVQPNTGLLGYSPLGGAGNGDGVVIDANAFGSGSGCGSIAPNAPFNLGRTLTHELGHYLLLDHIWGDGCNVDDEVADTPDQQGENYDCPAQGTSSCGSNDMHMSYMDYTNDACMYMFSAGQTARMEAYISSSLSNVTANAVNVCSTSGGSTGGVNTGGGNTSACDTPGTATVTNLTPTSAKLTWAAVVDAVKYGIRYRVQGTNAWTTVNTVPSSKTIQGLTAETTYQYQLRAECPSGWTAWSSTAAFTTAADTPPPSECVTPGVATVELINPTKAVVSWDAIPDAIRYRIRYRAVGTASWMVFSPANPTRTLSNLDPNTTYQFQLRTKCPAGWTGWNSMDNFQTDAEQTSSNAITIRLVLDDYSSETSWELLDEYENTVESDGPFTDGAAGTVEASLFELEEGCYTLFIDDSYGDGICCDYGDGSIQVLMDGEVIAESDGYFGYYDYMDFCITTDGFTTGEHRKDEKQKRTSAKPAPKVVNR